MTVWVVVAETDGDTGYNWYIVGVYSTKEAAEAVSDGSRVEEVVLDAPPRA